MHVVTIGGFKGGTGKTTFAAVLGSYLSHKGVKVGLIDLDAKLKVASRFMATRERLGLPAADRIDCRMTGGFPDQLEWFALIERQLKTAESEGFECVLIDTVSDWKPEVVAAHMAATTIITTLNESPIDLYQIMRLPNDRTEAANLPYLELVERINAFIGKGKRSAPDWTLAVNRRSPLSTKVGRFVDERVETLCRGGTVRQVSGLTDRVAYRTMMHEGRTFFDAGRNMPPSNSEAAALREIERLVETLFPAPAETPADWDGVSDTEPDIVVAHGDGPERDMGQEGARPGYLRH